MNASDGESLPFQHTGFSAGPSEGYGLAISGGMVYVTGSSQNTLSGTTFDTVLLSEYAAATDSNRFW